jgi:hypothetical protein
MMKRVVVGSKTSPQMNYWFIRKVDGKVILTVTVVYN